MLYFIVFFSEIFKSLGKIPVKEFIMKLDKDLYKNFDKAYEADPINKIMENPISNVGVVEASKNKRVINDHNFTFTDEVDHKNITNQKKTGRCWMFAGLNMARPKVIKDLNLEEFEFSETYLYFYDNMEKTNVFLEKVIETRDMDINSREVIDALSYKTQDGGYFEYFLALIDKYGIVPKDAMGESFNTEDSDGMFDYVEEIIKKYAMDMRRADEKDIENLRKECLEKVYKVFVKCIGRPVESFDFEYYDKDKKYHIYRNLTPKSFYDKYLGDFFDGYIRLINDPRERNPYGRVYTNPEVKNLVETEGLVGLNVPTSVMKDALKKSIKDGKTSWFACDVGKSSDRKAGILDDRLYNYDKTLADPGDFSKADRIDSRRSMATHAMNITGFKEKDGEVSQWKVENSWGDENGKKGIFSMTDSWFDEYTYELIIEKKYVEDKYLEGFDKDYIEYDKFDPFSLSLKNIR